MEDRELDRLRAAVRRVLAEVPDVAAAYAYGSRVTGRAAPESDLDVALLPAVDERPDDPLFAERIAVRIAGELGDVIEVDAHLTCDLPLTVLGRIVTSGLLLYEADPSVRVAFETSTRRRYFDFAPLLERDAREGIVSGG